MKNEAQDTDNPMDDPWSLAGKGGIVIGAASGIGLATARAIARTTTDLVLVDRSPEVEEVAESLGCFGLALDITAPDAPDLITSASSDPLDFLVNCAGIQRRGAALDLDDESWHTLLETNWNSIRRLTTRVVRKMLAQGRGGSIVNVTSASVDNVMPGIVPYSIAKAALTQWTRGLAAELGPLGIRVNAVAPGYIETAMTRDAMTDPSYVQRALTRTPLGYIAPPEEVAEPIVFLLSRAARYVTGVVLPVDGGFALGV